MNRTEFLKSLGLSSGALMAVYCMGTLTSCSSSKDDPAPGTGTGTGTGAKVNFTLDLANANKALATPGAFVIKDDIIIANAKSGYVALSKACTHQGTTVEYQANNDRFYCPNHGSNFSTTGSVINGPAASPLKSYKIELMGTNLRVFES
ncbi:MAG: Rieske (2Fe-2S) protein [Cytophagaceae bacterium]|nr:Rieske (2Fe-2S) protein [Cytophagaceae bacterium]